MNALSKDRVIGIIPARHESGRLPGKLLLADTGMTVLEHTWRQAEKAETLNAIYVATDSPAIKAAAQGFGAAVIMTGPACCGSNRAYEASCHPWVGPHAIVVNIQGDEPEIDPETINDTVHLLRNSFCEMTTACTPIKTVAEFFNHDCVKVVKDDFGRALWFSRSPIPWQGHFVHMIPKAFRHIGIYAFRKEFLKTYHSEKQTPLELLERLEQIRAIELTRAIGVVEIEDAAPSVNSSDDYLAFVSRCIETHPGQRRP